MALRLASSPMNVTIIQCYAPTFQYDEDDIEAFYEDTSKLMKKYRQDRLIIYGDFNAKVGAGNKSDVNGIYGIGRRNKRGERLVQFCKENSLVIGNTLFKQHPRRTFTWTSSDGQTRNQIDYMLIQNRWKTSLKNVKTKPGADVDTDHMLLWGKIKWKLRRMNNSERQQVKWNIQDLKCENTQQRYEVSACE